MIETYSEDISKTRSFEVSFIYVVMKFFNKGAHSIKNPIRWLFKKLKRKTEYEAYCEV